MPAYEILQDPSGVAQIVYPYETEDGGAGMHLIPLDAVATRMALLNLDDPGQALDAILDELELPPSANPYAPVYRALAEGDPEPLQAHREALDVLNCAARCDDRQEAEFKSLLRSQLRDYLDTKRWEFIIDNTAQLPPSEPGDE